MSERGSKTDRVEALGDDAAFGEAVGRLGPLVLAALVALERSFRKLHPPDFESLRAPLVPLRERLQVEIARFTRVTPPTEVRAFRDRLGDGARLAESALGALVEPGREGALGALRAMHEHAEAQGILYPLREVLPPLSAFFAEPFRSGSLSELEAQESDRDRAPRVGLFRAPGHGESGDEAPRAEGRGGFDLYVPESYDGREAWPLIVALHGGSGHGSDFLWSWLREARSRRCLLLAPTSRGRTWSLHAPEVDGRALCEMAAWVAGEWHVDSGRVLLTGLSDGATMTLLVGLGEDVPFTHLAPVSGVLHPMNFANGNLDRAEGVPIELVHGALDWMFPVALAREAATVAVAGRAMHRMLGYARETGAMTDFPEPVDIETARDLPREHVFLLATGSQGEHRGASASLARDSYFGIDLGPGDHFLFSSKTIPGNELGVARVINQLVERGVEVVWDDPRYHVSGHANRPDLKALHALTRPDRVVPMHGELRHLVAHGRLAAEGGFAHVLAPNGTAATLSGPDAGTAEPVADPGRLYLDGTALIGARDGIVRERLRMGMRGHVAVSVVIDEGATPLEGAFAIARGLPEGDGPEDLAERIETAVDAALSRAPAKDIKSDSNLDDLVTRTVRRIVRDAVGKKPTVAVLINRLDG